MAGVQDPASLQEALESFDAAGWQQAWESELDSL